MNSATEHEQAQPIEVDLAGRVAEQPWPSRGSAYFALAAIILATMLNFFDASVFSLMVERIKVDFRLTDDQLGWLIGPANIIFYVFVGIPLARMADIYPRKWVLAGGITVISTITALGGLAQSFAQLFASRMLIGAGSSAHAPGSYSLLSDLFPPRRLPRAIAWLQLGFIGGTTLGPYIGGRLLGMVSHWRTAHWFGLSIFGWQWILIMLAAPGAIIAILLGLIKEPQRRGVAHVGQAMPIREVMREIMGRKAIYFPLFFGLALSALETLGMQAWQAPFMIRTYGWTEQQIGSTLAPMLLLGSIIGLFLGTVLTELLAKKYRDANVRATTLLFSATIPCAVAAPMMPRGELALGCLALAFMFGIAAAIPQNAAIQRITPNEMRGQVTAIYLFMFTFFGAMGSLLIGSLNQHVFGALWKTLAISAGVLLPLAAFMIYCGMTPYGREVARLEALEKA